MALTGLTKIQKVGISTTTIPTLGGSENTGVVLRQILLEMDLD